MGKSKILGSGGSGVVKNSIVEEFLAESEVINANTFVEFVNKTTVSGGTVEIKNNSLYCSCVKLDDNRVLQFSSISGKSYATVIKISNGAMEFGTTLNIGISTAYLAQAVKLDDSTVFALISSAETLSYGVFLTVNDMTVTQESVTQFTINIGNYYYFRILLLNQNKVLVQTSGGYLHLLTLSGTTVSLTTSLQYCTSINKYADSSVGITKLSDSKVLISYGRYYNYRNNYNFLIFSIVDVTSSTLQISKTLETSLGTYGRDSAIDMGNGSLCMLMYRYEYSGSTYVPGYWGFIVRVINNEIVIGPPVYIKSSRETYFLSLVPFNANTFYLSTYSDTNEGANQIYVIPVCVIEGTIAVGEPLNTTSLSTGAGFNSMVTFNDCILMIYANSTALFDTTGPIIKVRKSKSIIHGITKSKATTSAKGKVSLLP